MNSFNVRQLEYIPGSNPVNVRKHIWTCEFIFCTSCLRERCAVYGTLQVDISPASSGFHIAFMKWTRCMHTYFALYVSIHGNIKHVLFCHVDSIVPRSSNKVVYGNPVSIIVLALVSHYWADLAFACPSLCAVCLLDDTSDWFRSVREGLHFNLRKAQGAPIAARLLQNS